MLVTLKLGGRLYEGWTGIRIDKSIEQLAGSFSLQLAQDSYQHIPPLHILAGSACEVWIDNQQVMSGYVDKTSNRYNHSSHEIEVSGREKTADLVDCTPIAPPLEWKQKKLEDIAADLAGRFDIDLIRHSDTGTTFERFDLQQGETAFEAIERMLRLNTILAITDAKGNMVLTKTGEGGSADDIRLGENALEISASHDESKRFGHYQVKGQAASSETNDSTITNTPTGIVLDADISRYRPLLIIAEGQINSDQAKKRATWERTVAKARSLTVDATVQGWKMTNGQLWPINAMTYVDAPDIGVTEPMLIKAVQFSIANNGGTLTSLTLAKKDAFAPEPNAPGEFGI